jgi:hypothetical protein
MPRPFVEVVAMTPAELRRQHADIGLPGIVAQGNHDFVLVGAPNCWLSKEIFMRSCLESETVSNVLNDRPFTGVVCCRRYWKRNLKTVRRSGTKRGGGFVEGIHFRCQGGRVRSMVSPLRFPGSGQSKERHPGINELPHPTFRTTTLTRAEGSQLRRARDCSRRATQNGSGPRDSWMPA